MWYFITSGRIWDKNINSQSMQHRSPRRKANGLSRYTRRWTWNLADDDRARVHHIACMRDDVAASRAAAIVERWLRLVKRECESDIHCDGRPEYFWTRAARKDSEIRAVRGYVAWRSRFVMCDHFGDMRVVPVYDPLRFNISPRAKCNAAITILSAAFCSAGLDQVEEPLHHRPWIHYSCENGY